MGDQHKALVIEGLVGSSDGGGGTSDYTDLTNKPKINGVTLNGNKSTSDLGIVEPWVGTAAEYAQQSASIPAGTPVIITDDQDIDTVPTQGSSNPITSGGVYTALAAKADSADFVPISKSAFDELTTKTAEFYFVYADPVTQQSVQNISPNLTPLNIERTEFEPTVEPEDLTEEVPTDDSSER